jgi:hypothetical protein
MKTLSLLLTMSCLAACDDGGAESPDEDQGTGAVPATDAGDATGADSAQPDAGPVADAARPPLEENLGVEETEGPPECDNLMDSHCLMPFPSDRFRVQDEGRWTLNFEGGALPVDSRGEHIADDALTGADGWGVATPVVLYWPGATVEGAVPVFRPDLSLEPDARTVILDSETGERVAHWVEADFLTAEAEHPNIVLRIAEPLAHSRRYIVAVRGLVDEAGAVLEAPAGFRALRDEAASLAVGVHARRARFEAEVFAPLSAHGVERGELQIAWDFTTGSVEDATGTLVAMRDHLLEVIGEDGPEYTWTEVVEVEDPYIAVIARGVVHVPSFLLPPVPIELERLRRDAEGRPVTEGTMDLPFTLQIPRSVLEGDTPGGVMQYGHGFLGRMDEANNGWLREMASRYQFLILASDMYGMAQEDAIYWGANLRADPAAMIHVHEKALQGILNQVAQVRMMKGRMLQEESPLLTRADGAPLYDPERVWYYGNSQGGTIGTIVMSVSTDLERGGLGVPGCCFPFLLHRSTVFGNFISLLRGVVPDLNDLGITLAILGGTGFRAIDSINYAPFVTDSPLPGTPPHRVLFHVAKEDAQVHNEASYMLARAAGVPNMVPAIRPVWGMAEQAYPYEGSAQVEYDFGMPDNPNPLLPPADEFDTHGSLRRQPEGQDQLMHFLEMGELINPCQGPCAFPDRP